MRIDNALPSLYTFIPQNESVIPPSVPANTGRTLSASGPAFVLDISPEAWSAYERSKGPQTGGLAAIDDSAGCETCKNRKYKDGSNDPSVSFQVPTRIDPSQAASSVMAHESEHVSHEQAKAAEEGRRIISQTVTIKTSVCPECGRIYVSGGVTRTVTAPEKQQPTDSQQSEIE